MKRPLPSLPLGCSYCGIINLNRSGSCLISLPEDFPDQDQITKLTLVSKPFIIVYTLTPIGSAMPNLHVSKEVSRHNTLDEFEIMKPKDLSKENLTRRTKNSSIPSHSLTETKTTKYVIKSFHFPHYLYLLFSYYLDNFEMMIFQILSI